MQRTNLKGHQYGSTFLHLHEKKKKKLKREREEKRSNAKEFLSKDEKCVFGWSSDLFCIWPAPCLCEKLVGRSTLLSVAYHHVALMVMSCI